MNENLHNLLRIRRLPKYEHGTLVLAFTGWMDGGDVSTGTVEHPAPQYAYLPATEED